MSRLGPLRGLPYVYGHSAVTFCHTETFCYKRQPILVFCANLISLRQNATEVRHSAPECLAASK